MGWFRKMFGGLGDAIADIWRDVKEPLALASMFIPPLRPLGLAINATKAVEDGNPLALAASAFGVNSMAGDPLGLGSLFSTGASAASDTLSGVDMSDLNMTANAGSLFGSGADGVGTIGQNFSALLGDSGSPLGALFEMGGGPTNLGGAVPTFTLPDSTNLLSTGMQTPMTDMSYGVNPREISFDGIGNVDPREINYNYDPTGLGGSTMAFDEAGFTDFNDPFSGVNIDSYGSDINMTANAGYLPTQMAAPVYERSVPRDPSGYKGRIPIGSMLEAGKGLYGAFQRNNELKMMREMANRSSAMADPFTDLRSRQQAMLNDSYTNPYGSIEDQRFKQQVMQAARRQAGKGGRLANPLHTRIAAESALAQHLDRKRQTLQQAMMPQNAASAGQIYGQQSNPMYGTAGASGRGRDQISASLPALARVADWGLPKLFNDGRFDNYDFRVT